MTAAHDGAFWLATLNALFNGTAAVLLVGAWVAIRSGRIELHRRLMLMAVVVSGLFLASYLTRMGLYGSRRFEGEATLRLVYLGVLATHSLLAALNLPLILRTLFLGLKDRRPAHRRIARWTLPIWTYVSVTGVVVYVLLYHA